MPSDKQQLVMRPSDQDKATIEKAAGIALPHVTQPTAQWCLSVLIPAAKRVIKNEGDRKRRESKK